MSTTAIQRSEAGGHTVSFRWSSRGTTWLVLSGMALIVVCALLAFGAIDSPRASAFEAKLVGWIGLIFFSYCLAGIIWRAATVRGPVITLSPEGLRDVRVAAEPIPWTAITGLSTWSFAGQKIMVVAIEPDVEARLTLTTLARSTRSANAKLGANGLCITPTGLDVTYDDLFEASRTYLDHYGLTQLGAA
ncbi:MAG: STM3941 family protein [Hyphomicrobiaceae bacterium]